MQNYDLLIVKGLRKYFPVGRSFFGSSQTCLKAVDGVDIAVKEGETLGLVGESGCGKTTVGRCILRIEEPTTGEIYFENRNILFYDKEELRNLRRNIQIIFQDPYSSLSPRQIVANIIGEAFVIHKILSRKERRERVRELMEVVGLLPDQINRYPHEFSGGQRQRICIARALALNPKLVIADEPVSALDVSIQAQILNLFVELQQKFNLTYVFISHDLSVVRHIADRVAVMYLGRIVELARSRALYDQQFHPYARALISAVPAADPLKKKQKVILEGSVPSPINPPPGCNFHPRCQHAQEICKQTVPRMQEVELDHWVACHSRFGNWA